MGVSPVIEPPTVTTMATPKSADGVEGRSTPRLDEGPARRKRPDYIYLEEMVRRLAAQRGWRAVIGEGNVDVMLSRGKTTIACQFLVAEPAECDVESLGQLLASGFRWVVMVSDNARHLATIRAVAKEKLLASDFERSRFFTIAQFVGMLDDRDAKAAAIETRKNGMPVKLLVKPLTAEEQKKRLDRINRVLARSLKRLREGGV